MAILVSFLFLLLAAGRLTDAKSDVVGAASDAARAASVEEGAGAARSQAAAAAADTVAGERLNCAGGAPTVDTEFVGGPSGNGTFEQGAFVHVTVHCTVNTSDLTFIGIGPSVPLDAEAWEPIDPNRSMR